MLDPNQNQREATAQWYAQWLAERYPDYTQEQREELALQFATQQNPLPKPPDGLTTEELAEWEADQIKLNGLRKLAYAYTINEMSCNPR